MILPSSAVFFCFKGGAMWLSFCHLQCLNPAVHLNVSFSPLIGFPHTAAITLARLLGLSAGLDAPAGMLLLFITEEKEEERWKV